SSKSCTTRGSTPTTRRSRAISPTRDGAPSSGGRPSSRRKRTACPPNNPSARSLICHWAAGAPAVRWGLLGRFLEAGTSANKPPGSQSGSAPTPTAGGALSSPMGALGANMIQTQFTQLVDQITKSVREVHLTVSWKEGKNVETLDLVTHVVSMGQGGDRNGNLAAAAQQAAQQAGGGWVNARTGAPVPNPRQGPNGVVEPLTGDPLAQTH